MERLKEYFLPIIGWGISLIIMLICLVVHLITLGMVYPSENKWFEKYSSIPIKFVLYKYNKSK